MSWGLILQKRLGMSQRIKIAIQKSGRLSEDSIALFKECGIKLDMGKGRLKSESSNFPAEFLFCVMMTFPVMWKMVWLI